MKLKALFALTTGLLLLASCGGGNPSSSSVTPSKSSDTSTPTPSSSEDSASYISYESESEISNPKKNEEEHDYASLKVNTPTNALADDFAYGADLSIVAEVEKNGGVFYNEDGVEEDVFRILAKDGVNYCRLRLWNDPVSKVTGLPYGGGDNDIETDIALAKRAKKAGMKVLIDFHYSDSWADPQKQWLPKEWKDYLADEIPDAVKDYTKESMQAFKDAGVEIDSVQIGNETNNKILEFPTSDGEVIADIVSSGVSGVKEVFPNAKTLVHLTNIKSPRGVYNFLDAVKDVPYDVVGLSYYPYWHGTMDNLENVMGTIEKLYNKPIWVVETAYGTTDEQHENCKNQFHSSTYENSGGYVTGCQGQATMLADIVDRLSKVNNKHGQGIFYWEPTWLPVEGSTWATPAGQYYNDNGVDGTLEQLEKYSADSCLPSWCNQGWFSYTGKALPSASTYRHIQQGDRKVEEKEVSIRQSEIEVNVNLVKGEVTLPEKVSVVTNLDALRQKEVTWNEDEKAAILAQGDGEYLVHGKVGEFDITAKVTAETNYVLDYSFEEQATAEEAEVRSPWEATCTTKKGVWIEAKSAGNLDGEKYFHWYNVNDFSFTLKQTLTGIRAGDYDLSTYIMAGENSDFYKSFRMWYQFEGQDTVYVDVLEDVVKGWGAPLARYMQRGVIPHIEVANDNTTITIGMTVEVVGSGWGHNDLWSFAKHKEVGPVEDYVADGALEDGGFTNQTLWVAPSDPWIVDGNLTVANDEAMKKDSDKYVKWWQDSAFKFDIHQNIKNLEAGNYTLSFHILSGTADTYNSFVFYYQIEGEEAVETDIASTFKAWGSSAEDTTVDEALPVVVKEGKKVTIGIKADAKAGAWGRMTDFALTK
ncbi:MAG: glycosyl hydrolase 53 family protein [Bacilli bacterium]|nr:glycosyl hydrolase 53 family protein [Bacilli bacterium]